MADRSSEWTSCNRWRERWEVLEALRGGGQGEAFRARRKTDGQIAFLKVIKNNEHAERRARFFREATAYDTYRISGVPTLIESNAQLHKESVVQPYIATEFVEGTTLREWREKRRDIALSEGISVVRTLLEVIRDCHAAGCVHRDIKPDNVIVKSDNSLRATLVDFGLSVNGSPVDGFETEYGQELGNKFLRLPELGAGSFLKQDFRSDLSFAGGIFFMC